MERSLDDNDRSYERAIALDEPIGEGFYPEWEHESEDAPKPKKSNTDPA
jgi:hypothetical protein